jgi:hypothetical protein
MQDLLGQQWVLDHMCCSSLQLTSLFGDKTEHMLNRYERGMTFDL